MFAFDRLAAELACLMASGKNDPPGTLRKTFKHYVRLALTTITRKERRPALSLTLGISCPSPKLGIDAMRLIFSDVEAKVKSLRRAFLVIDRSKRSVRTKDARDSGLFVIRYYGYLIVDLYLNSRTHLSLETDVPNPRAIQPPETRNIVAIPEVGGLHHRYERRAA